MYRTRPNYKKRRILFKHNLFVFKEMYRRKEKRLMQYLKIAPKEKDIELSDIMKNIICEEGWMSS